MSEEVHAVVQSPAVTVNFCTLAADVEAGEVGPEGAAQIGDRRHGPAIDRLDDVAGLEPPRLGLAAGTNLDDADSAFERVQAHRLVEPGGEIGDRGPSSGVERSRRVRSAAGDSGAAATGSWTSTLRPWRQTDSAA